MYQYPLIKPYINDTVRKKVMDVLDSGYLTEGPVTAEFERQIKKFLGCPHAIAVTSCTVGLEMALRAYGIGHGDEVIVPDYTYPATASAVCIAGAVPVIVDIDFNTMLIDYDAAAAAVTKKTKAIIPVSLFGNPLNYDLLGKIKKKYNLKIIEDAACALGASYNNVRVGNQADISVFSLHPRKFITTGEGGIITTGNAQAAEWLHSYKHFGISKSESRESTEFAIIGANYKLSNVLAAIGLGQMEDIDILLKERALLVNRYTELLAGSGITLPSVISGGSHSWQTFSVLIKNRDTVLKGLRSRGIEAQIGTYALHMHPAFTTYTDKKKYPNSLRAFHECLALPLYHGLQEADQQYIIAELKKLL